MRLPALPLERYGHCRAKHHKAIIVSANIISTGSIVNRFSPDAPHLHVNHCAFYIRCEPQSGYHCGAEEISDETNHDLAGGVVMKKSSKSRLTKRQMGEFPGETLFDRIARAVCSAGTLPAKELFETWEFARRVRRRFRGGRVVDFAGGHGLLAQIMLLLDDSSPEAVVVDRKIPKNAGVLSRAVTAAWPRLEQRVRYVDTPLEAFQLLHGDLAVSVHACGSLTDTVLDLVLGAGARVAVLPCCHDFERSSTGGLEGWIDGALAVDVTRAARLRHAGYEVITRVIPEEITPMNRLLMGEPDEVQGLKSVGEVPDVL